MRIRPGICPLARQATNLDKIDPGLEKLCREVRQLAANIQKDLRSRQPERASQGAALYMYAKGYKSFQAAQLLFRSGLWQDAASIGRTLLELGFQARWLNLDPERRGPLFLRHELRDRLKLLRSLKSSGSKEVQTKAGAFLEKLASTTDFDKSWRTWWSEESNIERLAKEMGLSPQYDLLYRPLCWFVHSSPFANAYYLREEEGRVLFDCQPAEPALKDRGFAEMLFSSAPIGLLEVLAAVDTVYELKRQEQFDRIGRTLKSYEEELQRVAHDRQKASLSRRKSRP
jgi:uncharacterized protein DUF5677